MNIFGKNIIKRNNDKHINKLKEIFIKTEKRK